MKLSAAFGLLTDWRLAFQAAYLPTLKAVFRSPALILHPREVSRIFMAHVWKVYGDGIDENARPAKEELLPNNCTGVVLDIGAGEYL